MKLSIESIYALLVILLFTTTLPAQEANTPVKETVSEIDFSDRGAVIETIENFYIGDHTGSIKHKKLSMHEKGAYRYVNRNGEYAESVFRLDSDDLDQSYKEELLSIEIYDKFAIARVRLVPDNREIPEYKVMTLHKAEGNWKITGISWGFGITQ